VLLERFIILKITGEGIGTGRVVVGGTVVVGGAVVVVRMIGKREYALILAPSVTYINLSL
jgi:hypothetical protein